MLIESVTGSGEMGYIYFVSDHFREICSFDHFVVAYFGVSRIDAEKWWYCCFPPDAPSSHICSWCIIQFRYLQRILESSYFTGNVSSASLSSMRVVVTCAGFYREMRKEGQGNFS